MSKYGHTKQYADWLKEDFDADVIAASSFNPTKLLAYKLTIFASGVYGDKLQIMEWFKKNSVGINPAKIMIAAVSWYTNDSEEAKEKLIKENYPENFKNVVPLFVINSGIDKKKINAMEKVQLVASQVAIDKHESRSSDDINALAIIKGYSDQTSKDNLKSLRAAVENFLHPPKNAPKPAAAEEKTPKPVAPPPAAPAAPAAEEKPAPAPQPVKKPAPVPKGEHEVTSLDDALAALGSGNILLNKPPMHRPAPDAEPPKPEAAEQPKTESAAPAGMEIPEVPTLADVVNKKAHSEPVHEEPAPAPAPAPEQPKTESHTYAGIEIPEVPTLADVVNKKAHSEPVHEKPAPAPAPAPEQPKTENHTYAGIEIPEVPTLADVVNKKAHSEPVHEEPAPAPAPEKPKAESNRFAGIEITDAPDLADTAAANETSAPKSAAFNGDDVVKSEGKRIAGIEISDSDDVVMSVSDDIDAINRTAEAPKPAPEIKREPVTLRRPEPVKPAEPTAPVRNSYLEFFSRKNKPAENPKPVPAESIQPAAEAPAPEPVYEAPKPAPAPIHEPVSTVDDFDFDILGNESSTAEKVSSRALNAVEALAKAKAKAAAEAKEPKQEAAESDGPTTYDVVSNSVGMDIPEPAAPVYEAPAEEKPAPAPAPVYEEEEEDDEPVYEAPIVQPEPEEKKAPEFSEDDVFMFSNDDDYDINDIDPSKLLEPEEPQKEHQRLDFKKLQEEIEASIEVNKKIRDKERFRNMRESERRALEEEQQKPKKGIKQPEDPDIFFKRPGKDYYASDSMPEIRFNRHKHDL